MDSKSSCMQVKCGVGNCAYNADNKCHAEALEVNAMKGSRADISDETCCTTFEDRK